MKRNKKILTILGVIGLVIIGIVFYFWQSESNTNKNNPTIVPVMKITAEPAKDVPTAFNNADFDGIVAFIASKSDDFSWVLDRGDTEIIFIDSANGEHSNIMKRMGATFFKGDATFCLTVSPEICSKADPDKHHIVLPSNIKRFQPYSNLPIIVHELRHVYQNENKTKKNCIDNEIEVYTWESKFWALLSSTEKQHMDGFDDSEIIAEDKRLELYKNGQLIGWVNEVYEKICK